MRPLQRYATWHVYGLDFLPIADFFINRLQSFDNYAKQSKLVRSELGVLHPNSSQ